MSTYAVRLNSTNDFSVQQAAVVKAVKQCKRPGRMTGAFALLCNVWSGLADFVPVDDVPESLQVLGASVLVVQVVTI